jgi:hypothetical protein
LLNLRRPYPDDFTNSNGPEMSRLSRIAIADEIRRHPDGVTCEAAIKILSDRGYTRNDAAAAVRWAMESGVAEVGRGLALFPATSV